MIVRGIVVGRYEWIPDTLIRRLVGRQGVNNATKYNNLRWGLGLTLAGYSLQISMQRVFGFPFVAVKNNS